MDRRAMILERRKVETRKYFDFTLLFMIFFVSTVGLIIIYSSSAYIAQSKNLPSTHFFYKQLKSLLTGTVALIIFAKFSYRNFNKILPFLRLRIATVILFFAYALQIYVTFFVKEGRNGSTRWMNIPFFGTFQPSEISKLAIVIFTAAACYRMTKQMNRVIGFYKIGLAVVPLVFLIYKENLSSAAIALVIFASICFVASRKYLYFFINGVLLLALVLAKVMTGGDYRQERIEIWKNLEGSEKGYQILQGLYAIASGGLFGTGLGNSAGKFDRIPEAYNDMIFTIICEELGLVGAIGILMVFVLILIRLFIIALNAPDLFGSLLTVGIMTEIALQVILNVAVVTNLVPSTGITLPFISYGGSSVLFLLAGIGMVLNVSSQIDYYA